MSAALEALAAALDKELGANSEDIGVINFLNTGFEPLNEIISGSSDRGLPFGRMIEIYGDSSSGKTVLASEFMIAAQKMGGIAIFEDWEKAYNVEFSIENGLNPKRPYWIYNKPRTWEEGNVHAAKACELIRKSKAIPDEAPIVVVFDSIAAAIPQSSSDKEITELNMNDTSALARVTSTTLKVMAQFAEDFNAIFIYLNQTREKIGVMFGSKVTTPGGKAMEFYATARLQVSRTVLTQGTGKGDEKETVGQLVTIKCVKSKLTAPFKTTKMILAFDERGKASFDLVSSLVDYMTLKKIIGGATWIEFDGEKFQGRAKLIDHIKKENKYEKLVKLFKDSRPT